MAGETAKTRRPRKKTVIKEIPQKARKYEDMNEKNFLKMKIKAMREYLAERGNEQKFSTLARASDIFNSLTKEESGLLSFSAILTRLICEKMIF